MFTPQGPTLRELAVQALSSIEHGYDLLAPKFDHTPFRTPDTILEAVGSALGPMGPFGAGLDLCCGTGAGMEVLRGLCRDSVTGVDISAGMLTVGRSRLGAGVSPLPASGGRSPAVEGRTPKGEGGPPEGGDRPPAGGGRFPAGDPPFLGDAPPTRAGVPPLPAGDGPIPATDGRSLVGTNPSPSVAFVRGDARALPFGSAFDLVVSFGAFGHFLPRELPGVFSGVRAVLRPGGRFAFPIMAPPRPGSFGYWTLLGFDTVMRVRNAVRRPTFVMYYRTFRLADVERELTRAGFRTELHALDEFGRRRDGSPRARMVVATREDTPAAPGGGA
ncbi:class I SAM-dependent methyltransferase [Streptomyces sp. NPDC026665]|uniref:class I SAM-dependent methyltransferase n=1 Tax=Streptomyces sp. NPDC026665 TaxID=3154798 RepID=UPI0033E215C8